MQVGYFKRSQYPRLEKIGELKEKLVPQGNRRATQLFRQFSRKT